MDWNNALAANVMDAWNEGVHGNEQLFGEECHEDNIRGYFLNPLRQRFAHDGFVVDSPYDCMNSPTMERVAKTIMLAGIAREAIPDMIIHRRNENGPEHNLLVLEIKKQSNRDWPHDVNKLVEMTSLPRRPRPFQYRFGLLLRFTTGGQIAIATLFENGLQYELETTTLLRR
jgi:hypothetical protein